jgi:hypothetical protein
VWGGAGGCHIDSVYRWSRFLSQHWQRLTAGNIQPGRTVQCLPFPAAGTEWLWNIITVFVPVQLLLSSVCARQTAFWWQCCWAYTCADYSTVSKRGLVTDVSNDHSDSIFRVKQFKAIAFAQCDPLKWCQPLRKQLQPTTTAHWVQTLPSLTFRIDR